MTKLMPSWVADLASAPYAAAVRPMAATFPVHGSGLSSASRDDDATGQPPRGAPV